MEKLVWLFEKHPNRSHAEFARHYIGNHAPLGAELARCLLGYTVNIVKSATDSGPHAVTEHWVPTAMDLLTPSIAYASEDDRIRVSTDDRTLFAGFAMPYIVVDEREIVPGESNKTPLREATPGVKLMWLYRDQADVPPPPTGVRRVVDGYIGRMITHNGTDPVDREPDYKLLRTAWADDLDKVSDTAGAVVTTEYRFIDAPLVQAASPR